MCYMLGEDVVGVSWVENDVLGISWVGNNGLDVSDFSDDVLYVDSDV